MGTEQPTKYYDDLYSRSKIRSWEDYRTPRKQLYEVAAEMIDPGSSVVDLGCGPGHFAMYLNANRADIMAYDGCDFSKVAIDQAAALDLPDKYYFEVLDLTLVKSLYGFPDNYIFVMMEVLEHIEDDLHVLNAIPSGSTCIISVPEFDNPAHVRTFADMDAVRARYGDLIDIQDVRHIHKWHLFKGVKKPIPS